MIELLAWAVLALLGIGLWQWLARAPRGPGWWQAAAGHALVLGLAGCGWVMWLPSVFGFETLPQWRWLWPLLPVLLLGFALWRRPTTHAMAGASPPQPALSATGWWLLIAVVCLIAVRAVWILDEVRLRPLFAWDAWVAWSAKARAWVLSGEATPFVDAQTWLALDGAGVRTSLAPHYPELLSWIEVWLAAAAGGWRDASINRAWPLLWLALLAGCHGQWRALGVASMPALVGLYALASLPLLAVHAALPGYADLWVATVLAFAALAWLRWRERGERGQLHLALVLTALLPMFKFEGMVWAIGLLMLMLWFALERHSPPRRMAAAVLAAAAIVMVSWLLGLGWLEQMQHLFAQFGTSDVGAVLAAMLAGLFAQDNWHLLWYLLPAVLIWRWRVLCSSPALAGLAVLLVACLLLVLLLFVVSQAGRWAESYTAVNRLVLQLAPLAVVVAVLALRDARLPDTRAPASAGMAAQ